MKEPRDHTREVHNSELGSWDLGILGTDVLTVGKSWDFMKLRNLKTL